jgi:hypothetical protein
VIEENGGDGKLSIAQPVGLLPVSLKSAPVSDPIRAAAFVDLVHTVVNSNEFSYKS